MIFRTLSALALLALSCTAHSETSELTLCYEDKDSYPWVMTDGSGLNLELLRLVEQALSLRVRYVAAPWKRCLSGLEQNTYDGAFASSYKAERLQMGHYPSRPDGSLDESKRLHTSAYSLYRRKGSAVEWNGQAFRDLDGRIGSLSGFSIVDFLRDHGVEVDETSRDPLSLLQMLKSRRIEAAALQSLRADFILQTHPELAAALEKTEPPLEDKPYYLMLSKALLRERPMLAERIWTEIERQRQSPVYRRKMEAFLGRP